MFYFYNSGDSLPSSLEDRSLLRLPQGSWRTHFYAVNGPAIPKLVDMIARFGAQFENGKYTCYAIDDLYIGWISNYGLASYGPVRNLVNQMGDKGTGTECDSDIHGPHASRGSSHGEGLPRPL